MTSIIILCVCAVILLVIGGFVLYLLYTLCRNNDLDNPLLFIYPMIIVVAAVLIASCVQEAIKRADVLSNIQVEKK